MTQTKVPTIVSPEKAAAARAALERVVQPTGDVRLALISTPDGFDVASYGAAEGVELRRLAAMASSMVAMARAVSRELGHGASKRLTFETEGGVSIFQAIGGAFPCILCLVLYDQAVLGRALWAANEVAQLLGQAD